MPSGFPNNLYWQLDLLQGLVQQTFSKAHNMIPRLIFSSLFILQWHRKLYVQIGLWHAIPINPLLIVCNMPPPNPILVLCLLRA